MKKILILFVLFISATIFASDDIPKDWVKFDTDENEIKKSPAAVERPPIMIGAPFDLEKV